VISINKIKRLIYLFKLIKFNKKGVEMSMTMVITLIILVALIIFVFIISGNLRSYLLSLTDRFSFRGR
jgi:hypothetical protein